MDLTETHSKVGKRAPFWITTLFLTEAPGRKAPAEAVVAAKAKTNKAWIRIIVVVLGYERIYTFVVVAG